MAGQSSSLREPILSFAYIVNGGVPSNPCVGNLESNTVRLYNLRTPVDSQPARCRACTRLASMSPHVQLAVDQAMITPA
jgi:hypothetical protein